ncbi:MAG: biopolymer transporter ExbD [Firmicutes bacterium]|jgi:biopolymer transport protein TolR|nr:biopolymer transporter ExbD [Bacillota bacterium]
MAVSQNQDDDVMASINVTPLTDVLLVLLIIFMIAASAMKKKIHLPVTHYKNKAKRTDNVISIEKNGTIFVGSRKLSIGKLESYLHKIRLDSPINRSGKHSDKVIIKADKNVTYGVVAEAMDAAKSAGLNAISLATKPLNSKKK